LHETVVWFTPKEARTLVRDWLADLAVAEYRAQPAGTLGSRLIAAFRHHFQAGARRVILMGSDCPGVDVPLVSKAFGSLKEHDLVLGPAQDGGYYLIGLQRPEPRLFRRVSWSTDSVLAQTLLRARRLGLRSAILPTLRDIDTPEDAAALGLLELQ
jgi:rSAM/selenodomain-associated transferase 1